MKLEFKESDFDDFKVFGSLDAGGPLDQEMARKGKVFAKAAVQIANARLAQMLKDATRVYGHEWDEAKLSDGNTFGWGHTQCSTDTHAALLINIEEIEK